MNNCRMFLGDEMTDDDELIQRARDAWDGMSWTDAKAVGIAAIPALFRAVDERDELRKMLRDFCSNQEASAAEMTATIAELRKRVAELEAHKP